MVRIKHRYLLVNILYPEQPAQASAQPHHTTKHGAQIPNIVQFHQPTPGDLTPQILLRTIREQVALLFGDYGAGITSSGLQGIPFHRFPANPNLCPSAANQVAE